MVTFILGGNGSIKALKWTPGFVIVLARQCMTCTSWRCKPRDMESQTKANEAIIKSVHSSALLPIVVQVPGMCVQHLSVSGLPNLPARPHLFPFLILVILNHFYWPILESIRYRPFAHFVLDRFSDFFFCRLCRPLRRPFRRWEAEGLDVAHDQLMARCFSLPWYLGKATIHHRPGKFIWGPTEGTRT